jgi:hypothetical protein
LGGDRLLGRVEEVGGFAGGEVEDVAQDQGGALAGWQQLERRYEGE